LPNIGSRWALTVPSVIRVERIKRLTARFGTFIGSSIILLSRVLRIRSKGRLRGRRSEAIISNRKQNRIADRRVDRLQVRSCRPRSASPVDFVTIVNENAAMHRQDRHRTDRPRTRFPASADLGSRLRALEGAPYPAYRDLRGRYEIDGVAIEILHVQPDPFAPPTRLRIGIPLASTGLEAAQRSKSAALATEDFFARRIETWLSRHREVGSVVRIDPAVQQILRRTALLLHRDRIELLLTAALPARGRRIEGRRAAGAVAEGIPRMVRETCLEGAWVPSELEHHRQCVEDHEALAALLEERGWVAFIADGSRLARRSGEEDTPLAEGNVPFRAPPELEAEVDLPHAGRILGTAIPKGVTLLCGGGFHGKSTLLRALAVAVYPHLPGDGRERIAVDPTAMAIRAEDGRAILGVDLRAFLRNLPSGRDPSDFHTVNASGSTSQAASILEAIEVGCRCLLIDEDTSATNFLLRDRWMAKLLREDQEPIVPLIARLREIHEKFGTSTILVVGGSGEAFRVADHVIIMEEYEPHDGTGRVESLRQEMGSGITPPAVEWPDGGRELPLGALRRRDPRIRALNAGRILVGKSEIDLGASGALVHSSQGRCLAALLSATLQGTGTERLPEIANDAARRIAMEDPGVFSPIPRGDLAEVRAQEIAMLFSRLRYAASTERPPKTGTERSSGG
jgi:predicted ABC-class ATPase